MLSPGKHPDGFVLLVEDDPELREVLAELLAEEGYRVETARTGVEAAALLDRTRAEKPRVILLDLLMPEMNGFELLAKLRTQGVDIPVIVISANVLDERDILREPPVRTVLKKPIDPGRLSRELAAICGAA